MSLESRAAQATRSLRASVAGRAPVGMPSVARRQRYSTLTSFGATAAAVMFVFGIASAMPSLFEPDQVGNGNPVPESDGSLLVVEPDDKQNDGALVDFSEGSSQLSIHQYNSQSDSPEPWTKFYGDAEEGAVVTATSDYGSADMVVSETGEFRLELFFDILPPPGKAFPILVMLGSSLYEFHFTSFFDPDHVGITANQLYGFSDDATAYDKFYGSAPAGSAVSATSPYGSAETVTGDDGQWVMKLWFSPLPLDDLFEITVDVAGEEFVFSFVSIFEQEQVSLSVSQVNTTSESSSPYVQFVGTGPAGTQLLAQSSYSSEDLVIGESGEFSLKVWFSPLPPAGEKFWITFKVDGATHGTYPFTSHFDSAEVGLSVDQYNTSSESSDPYAKFLLTGPVGTQVDIYSPYGSTSHTMGSTNEHVKLWFSSLPPAGVEFAVTVKINGDVWGTYPFTSWYEEPEPVAKTANSTYGTCAEDPPYDIYYGTAPEGTSVSISSPYGSGETTANGSGEWSKQVFFTGATIGEPFTVTVTVGGEVFTFGMTVTA